MAPSDQTTDSSDPLEDIDWESMEPGRSSRLFRPLITVVLLVLLVATGAHSVRAGTDVLEIGGRDVGVLDAMYGLALLVVLLNLGAWVLRNPGSARSVVRRLRGRPVVAVCSSYLVFIVSVATVYPFVVSEPLVDPLYSFQPPAFASLESIHVNGCAGETVGERCRGSLEYPLGTDYAGQDILVTTLLGLHTSLQVGIVSAVLATAAGTTVGITAGYAGGRHDELLMRYVDLQQALPAFFVYIFLRFVFTPNLALMILVFGLLSWGGMARLVRNEVTQRRGEAYVQAAEAAGASRVRIVGRHVLPNVSNSIVTSAVLLVPTFVIYEAALSFLYLGDGNVVSLGSEITTALNQSAIDWWVAWWTPIVPVAFLCTFVLALSVVGDSLQDVLDPRR